MPWKAARVLYYPLPILIIAPAWGVPGGGGGGGTLVYIRRLGSFFLVQNFEFRNFLGFSEK